MARGQNAACWKQSMRGSSVIVQHCSGIMENKMETTVVYWDYRDNGKENGSYCSILGL